MLVVASYAYVHRIHFEFALEILSKALERHEKGMNMNDYKVYQCAMCKQTHKRFLSEEGAAVAEMKENFGENIKTTDCIIICDACYKELMLEFN